jgi:hypothetical protein
MRRINLPPSSTKRKAGFRPVGRGDLHEALSSPEALDRIRPTSPLPVAWLRDVRLHGDLSARDAAALDFALAAAKECSEPEIAIPRDALARYIGERHRDRLDDCLARLSVATVSFDIKDGRVREWADRLPLVCVSHRQGDGGPEEVVFSFPAQVSRILFAPLRYAHIELAALPRMRSRWGVRLYGRLLAWITDQNIDRVRGGHATWEIAPVELAAELGWEATGDFDFATFRRVALEPAIKDLRASHKLAVNLSYRRGSGRGRPVEAIILDVRVRPADRHEVQARPMDEVERQVARFLDDPRFRVSPGTLARAKGMFPRERKAFGYTLQENAIVLRKAWERAVYRALEGIDVEIEGREARGQNLLNLIDRDGPDDAAWRFFREEASAPDLVRTEDRENGFEAIREATREQTQASLAAARRASAYRRNRARPVAMPPAPSSQADEPKADADSQQQPEPEPAAPESVTVVLDGLSSAAFGEIIHPFRAKARDENGVRMFVAFRGAHGRHIVDSTPYRLRPEALDDVASLDGVADVLRCGKAESQAILRARDDENPAPSSVDLTLVLANPESAAGLRSLLAPWLAAYNEFGLDIAIAFEQCGEWQVIERFDVRAKPGSEDEIAALVEVDEVLPYSASAARVILERRNRAEAA